MKTTKTDIFSIDLKYGGIDYDYSRSCNCEENGCDMICRCSKIEDARITDINLIRVASSITGINPNSKNENNIIKLYCVERLLVIHKMYNADSYEIATERGYYGEEVSQITMNFDADLKKDIDHVLQNPSTRLSIEYVLVAEYGHLIDKVKYRRWQVNKIPKGDIVFGNEDYRKKICKDSLAIYKDFELPRGIVVKSGDKYNLIDGYHRCSACKKDTITMIVGDKKLK